MFKLSALNDTTEDITSVDIPAKDTKEAQEAQAFKLYNEALRLQQNNCRDEAVSVYEQLLEAPLIIESATTLVNEHNEAIEHPLKDPGLILKYSAHKNVAIICASRGNVKRAMENYLQAVMLDTSDVTLWYKIGIIAAKLSNLHLSRRALTQGLECNPNHWPCLDSLITVCYAILDYENCLGWISKALLKDPLYKKGIYLRRKMISECPHLRKDFDHLFQDCGIDVFELEISEQDAKLVLDEALTLRENNRKLCIPPEIPDIPVKLPLASLTWLNLGKSLIATYEYIETQDEPISITNRIEMKVRDEKSNEGAENITEPKTHPNPTLTHPSNITVEKAVDMGSLLEQTAIAVDCMSQTSVNPTCSNVNVSERPILQDSDSLLPSSWDLTSQNSTPNSQKKAVKKKKQAENKISEQGRRSERRSLRMKRSLSKIIDTVPCQPQEMDFRQILLLLLPRTLQVGQNQTAPMDLDSDTNSQDSSLLESLNSSQCSVSNVTASTTTFVASTDVAMDVTFTDAAEPSEKMGTTRYNCQTSELSGTAKTVAKVIFNGNVKVVPNADKRTGSVVAANFEKDYDNEWHSTQSIPEHIICPSLPTSPADVSETAKVALNTSKTNDALGDAEVDSKTISKFDPPLPSLPSSPVLPPVCSTSSATAKSEGLITQVTPSLCQAQCSLDASACGNVDLKESAKNASEMTLPERDLGEEAIEVQKFIEAYNHKNCGIMHLLQLYCRYLGRRTHLKWEAGLKDVFVKAFEITQPTVKLEAFTEDNLDSKDKIMFAFYILTHLECVLDEKYKKHSLDFDYSPSKLEYSDMGYIIDASFHPEIFEEDPMPEYRFKNFILRFHWVRANYFFLSGDRDSAFCELTVCSKLCFQETEIQLQHLEHHNKVKLSMIKKRLTSLQRFQILEQVGSLFVEEKYSEVIKLLTPESDCQVSDANTTILKSENGTMETGERRKLLEYLIKASVALCDVGLTMKNLSFVMHEATESISHLVNSKFEKDTKSKLLHKWNSLLSFCCENLTKSLDLNSENLALLDKEALIKVTSSLLSLVNSNMLHLPTKTQFSVEPELGKNFLRPMVLLFRITKFEEERRPQSLPVTGDFTGYVKILLAAHEFLGDKGLCCVDDGTLLRLLLKNLLSLIKETKPAQVIEKVDEEDSKCSVNLKEGLQSKIEQCFFCLYGYPSKTGKSRGLVEHSSQQTALKWEDAMELYGYFCPEILPGFDSYKINTMPSEMAGLLTTIIELVPEKIANNLKVAREVLYEYLSANDAHKELKIPKICCEDDLKVIEDVHYLLADYYFKNKEMVQAAEHYLSDLCVNPKRFDSWAGLALVRSSIIDQKLRMGVTKSLAEEPSILKLSNFALLCFEKAVNIDQGSTTLWIEFGSLAYWMHSFFSRQKRLEVPDISEDEASVLQKQKSLMLDLAEKCFNSALTCDPEDVGNEEWLLQYMLGKVLEKKMESPQKYLPKYARSASLLHLKHAKYPKKIQFKSYQSNYAIEALELYFRLHASILKLVQHELNMLEDFDDGDKRMTLTCEDYDLFDDLIEEAQEGYFVKRESLPYSQLHDKPVEGQTKKQTTPGKLDVTGSENQSGLSTRSLLPDSVVSALNFQLTTERDSTGINANFPDKTAASNGLEIGMEMPTADTQPADPTSAPNAGTVPSSHSPKLHSVVQMTLNTSRAQLKCLTEEQRRSRALKVMKLCVSALHLCLRRLPQHYKSLYRLADLYWRCSSKRRHVTWSRDLLLSSETPWQQLPHMPCQGLLHERNKTNLFNSVWKILVDEIDRPGSFGCHLYRCILLLLDVLLELKDHDRLLYLHNILGRNPDQGRKYLQDHDRIHASKFALSYSVKALYNKVTSNSPIKSGNTGTSILVRQPVYPKEKDIKHLMMSETMTHLIDAGKIYQQKQRAGNLNDSADSSGLREDLLLAAYRKYISACPEAVTLFPDFELLPNVAKVERIVKFCLQYTTISTATSGSMQGANTAVVAVAKTDSNVVTVMKKSPLQAEKEQDKTSPFFGKATPLVYESVKRAATGILPQEDAKKQKLSPVLGVSTAQNSGDIHQEPKRNVNSFLKQSADSIHSSTSTKQEEGPIDLSSPKLKTANSSPQKQSAMYVLTSKPVSTQLQFGVGSKSARSSITDWESSTEAQSTSSVPISRSHDTAIDFRSIASGKIPLSYSTIVETITEGKSKNTATKTTLENNCSNIEEHADVDDLLEGSGVFRPENRFVKLREDSKIVSTGLSNSTSPIKAEVETVVQGSHVYTKIVPTKLVSRFSLSPRSAFTPRKIPMTLKQNRQLEKLKTQNKAPLLRSASLPESSNCPGHKTLQRTSSISDYTKQILKRSLLMRTSASFVRKPSITQQEIEEVLGDPESSQSEEEEEEIEATFKPLVATTEYAALKSGSISKNIDIPIAITPVSTPSTIGADSGTNSPYVAWISG